jgi:gliding motility-associated-like protein
MDFELLNSEIQCDGDVCGYNCARGHYWAVTIEARTIENVITLSRDTICAGDTVTLTAFPDWGVPPYTYVWSDGQTDSIITFTTETDAFVSCTAFDVCGNPALPQDIFLVAKPSPDANAGDTAKLCEGGSATLGGTPTTTGFAPTFVWTAEPANATTFLNTTNSSNPLANIPAGTIDTFLYIVRVNDQGCFRRDSVYVFSGANPTVTVVPDTAYICPGEGATFNTTEPFVVYNWSDGSNNPELTVFSLGNFDVTITDGNGCTASSNTVTTAQPNLPTFDLLATPDSIFNFGESAILGATIDLNVPPVDSFGWGPSINISCLDCPDPVVSPEADQFYVLEVYSQGCRILDSIFIDIKFPNAYWIPKAFTPNLDGINDRFFIIKESGVTVTALQVFNRWGQKIYDNVFPWDGTSKGEQMDMGVYSYIFKLRLADGKELVEAGQVTLIR